MRVYEPPEPMFTIRQNRASPGRALQFAARGCNLSRSRAVTLYDECYAVEGAAGSSPNLHRPIQAAAKHHGASVKHGELRRWPAGQRNIGERSCRSFLSSTTVPTDIS